MNTYTGKCVFGGWAVGKIKVFLKGERHIKKVAVEDAEREIERFNIAKEQASNELKKLYGQLIPELGKADAAIFQMHQMFLEDVQYISAIETIIREQMVCAEYAVNEATEKIMFMFATVDNAYLRSRAADVKDISNRLIALLCGTDEPLFDSDEPIIIFAHDLSPSEAVALERHKILAFVTASGAAFSHTAILARTMNIPLIIKANIELDPALNGTTAVVNGSEGLIYVDPTPEFLLDANNVMNTEALAREALNDLRGIPNTTVDGRWIMLDANICYAKDVVYAIRNDAGGVGMYRSEFLYLEKEDFPDEETLFEEYKSMAEILGKDMKCIIRTLDIGADKQLTYFSVPEEENPAMGVRSIRMSMRYPDIFRTQLRAIYRASVYGQVGILYPMITSVEELRRVKDFSASVREEVILDGHEVGEVATGIMIETPAAVMVSDLLAKEVDFFNIGTNDLAQYAMAADRQNHELDEYFNPDNPALLRMIKLAVDNAKSANVRVEICGELASNTELTAFFLIIGVDGLSVAPSVILPLRKLIRDMDLTGIHDEVLEKMLKL